MKSSGYLVISDQQNLVKSITGFKDPVYKALVTQLGQMRVHTAQVLQTSAVGPLHKLRVAALRASFALKFFRKYINAPQADQLQREFAWARHVMAQRRDWDVFSLHLLKDFQFLKMPSFKKRKIFKIIRSHKAKARRKLTAMLRSLRYKKMLQGLKKLASTRKKIKLDHQSMLKGVLKGLEHKQAVLRFADLHQIRIRFKNLRYAYEFFADFYDGKMVQRRIHHIVDVQNVLGEYHDGKKTLGMMRDFRGMDQLKEIEKDRTRKARKNFVKIYKSGQVFCL